MAELTLNKGSFDLLSDKEMMETEGGAIGWLLVGIGIGAYVAYKLFW